MLNAMEKSLITVSAKIIIDLNGQLYNYRLGKA